MKWEMGNGKCLRAEAAFVFGEDSSEEGVGWCAESLGGYSKSKIQNSEFKTVAVRDCGLGSGWA